ncbi:hypothetical protein CVT24_008263 [Panaeolus cyanescens]|uniref:ABC transporter domain-containing protein n=1 Tax=Panaeolus cyanescens TaxID=181874 RepID=A0A409W0K2_9AGAR|nr:hypothetical protein CVT24_008263 [Panaeolus cyanescens]
MAATIEEKSSAIKATSSTTDSPTSPEKLAERNITISMHQLGVWKLKVAHSKSPFYMNYYRDFSQSYPLFVRLTKDIYNVSPRLFTFYIFSQIWGSIEEALMMHLSGILLRSVENGLKTGSPDVWGIGSAVVARLACSLFAAFMSWQGELALAQLRTRVTTNFNMYLMSARLRVDLPTSKDKSSESEATPDNAWYSLNDIISFFSSILSALSQIALIFHLSRSTGGPLFAILCILRPVVSLLGTRTIWDKAAYGYVDNKDYTRMKSLTEFAGGSYRQDIISGNLGEWIMSEFKKAYDKLTDVTVEHPYSLYDRTETPYRDMMHKAIGDLPMVYCALITIMRPSHFSLTSLAILQQSSTWLGYSLGTVFQSSETFRQAVTNVRKLYEAGNVVNKMSDGAIPYPAPLSLSEKGDAGEMKTEGEKGMGFELKEVTFTYPGSQSTENALSSISLTIKPGQLVVIVGSNGSGKSTLIRILSRLYDPTSGQVLIDNRPSSSYLVGDLHRATAILSQESSIYPLTLAENIGIGYPEKSNDIEMIKKAAEEGGASEFIKKLEAGLETRLDPMQETFSINLYNDKEHPLSKELDKLAKPIDVSGGEKQKVVAARTFMRFYSGKVKFVAVDEPSSALDAEAELHLFQRLIAARQGKTMVFVTHRFGHLTKFADVILCMKGGRLEEMGSHAELMAKQGEYANLYNIQANAFSAGGEAAETPTA